MKEELLKAEGMGCIRSPRGITGAVLSRNQRVACSVGDEGGLLGDRTSVWTGQWRFWHDAMGSGDGSSGGVEPGSKTTSSLRLYNGHLYVFKEVPSQTRCNSAMHF